VMFDLFALCCRFCFLISRSPWTSRQTQKHCGLAGMHLGEGASWYIGPLLMIHVLYYHQYHPLRYQGITLVR
jgi:hypothetical protein